MSKHTCARLLGRAVMSHMPLANPPSTPNTPVAHLCSSLEQLLILHPHLSIGAQQVGQHRHTEATQAGSHSRGSSLQHLI